MLSYTMDHPTILFLHSTTGQELRWNWLLLGTVPDKWIRRPSLRCDGAMLWPHLNCGSQDPCGGSEEDLEDCVRKSSRKPKRLKLGEWNNFWRLICLSQLGELWRDSSQISENKETRDRPGSRKWPPSEGGEGEREEERKTAETSTGGLFCTSKCAKMDRPFLFLPWLTSSGPGWALEGGRAPRSSKDTQDRVTLWGSCRDTVWLMPSVLAISWNSSDVISKKKWSEVISIIFILIFLFFRESIWILLLSSPRMLWFTC